MPRLFIANKRKGGYRRSLSERHGDGANTARKKPLKPQLRISVSADKSYDKVHCGRCGIVV
jgi:hypothetical protein